MSAENGPPGGTASQTPAAAKPRTVTPILPRDLLKPVIIPRDSAEDVIVHYEIGFSDGYRRAINDVCENRISELWCPAPELDAAARRLGLSERPR
ncbi:hypothetical protein GCM10009765_65040 [Fodinicola feengrottensis]|uniref:Uncharacterized protein n=1 Tax=Fodinicola feengrottensis TaxID=435914 RepID=A0ABN2IK03_9ACTN